MTEIKLSPSSRNMIYILCAGLVLGAAVKMFAFDMLHVSGRSMEPSIHDRSTISVNRLAYGLAKPWGSELAVQWKLPAEGDVVIFLYNNKIVVKRCVATEGQLLEISAHPLYTLMVGDKNIPLTEEQFLRFKDCTSVPEGYFLAIGDNYEESIDSRNYGFVSVRNVLGKVICK